MGNWYLIDPPMQEDTGKWIIIVRDGDRAWLATIECDTKEEADELIIRQIMGEIDLVNDTL